MATQHKQHQKQHQEQMQTLRDQNQKLLATLTNSTHIGGNNTEVTIPSFTPFDASNELWSDHWTRFITFTRVHLIQEAKQAQVFLTNQTSVTSYYKSSSVCLFVCLSVCLFVPYLLRGPLTDLRQTWWVYVGGPRNCP